MLFNTLKLPSYKGLKWLTTDLPSKPQNWPLGKVHSSAKDHSSPAGLVEQLQQTLQEHPWIWPKVPILFFSDLHADADADAFMASLVASGGIKKTGPFDQQFKLTHTGRKARFVIGGDCFDKGPSNLRLLRCIRLLMDSGAKVHILAGNHDIRVKLGIRSVNLDKSPKSEHFFIRMGAKAIPFLKEIEQHYLQGKHALKHIPDAKECRKRLYPSESWFKTFPEAAKGILSEKIINKECKHLQEKINDFENDLQKAGMDIRIAYAAAIKWQELFLEKDGEFYWYFKKMRLVLHKGSFLYVHAGVDDRIAHMINDKGVNYLNQQFKQHLQDEMFDFYYGPLANTIRTKYRDIDMPMTKKGNSLLRKKGIYAIVHGHKNLRYGQRIMLRKGMVNFECDASVDRHTRKKENIGNKPGYGAAVTIFQPQGRVLGISTDYPYIKLFQTPA
ncbi:metallophosphoesterase [Methyloprofundus sp.]|uniref:metallophosphoesterase n=1 Tax=Methyloprofundus sp. TaxID=2020875 RepID=UPI003D151DE0